MKKSSAPKINGKNKSEIADEAIRKIGLSATIQQVDVYFQNNYGLPHCERSMYFDALRRAKGFKPPPRVYKRKPGNLVDLIAKVKKLANEVGGLDYLAKLIEAMK